MEELKEPKTQDEISWVYNSLDCMATWEIFQAQQAELKALPKNFTQTYQDTLEKQLVFTKIEYKGIKIDEKVWNKLKRTLNKEYREILAKFDKLCFDNFDKTFNPRSPKQLKELLNLNLGLKLRSTDRSNLEAVKAPNALPYVSLLLSLRDISKQLDFFKTTKEEDKRFRCRLNPAGTNTGRSSCSASDFGTGKNMQNVDRRLRVPFIPDEGKIFINVDLEQADSRCVGARCYKLFASSHGKSWAGSYLDACESGDLHTKVAEMVWPELVGKEGFPKTLIFSGQDTYRQVAKKCGHATNYGVAPRTLAKILNLETSLIKEFQTKYFKAFPCIKEWQNWVKREIASKQSLTTLAGRTRYFFDRITSSNTFKQALAYEPQSLTAHFIDQAIKYLDTNFPQIDILIQVHDSILLQTKETPNLNYLTNLLENVVVLDLDGRNFTIPYEAKSGLNWGDYSIENPKGLKA